MSEPYDPDNLLDRRSNPATLQVHYDQEHLRESELLAGRLEDWHRKRYHVLPGLTGLWQISGRSELDFDELVRLDFLYLERWSVGLDLTILLKTIPAVLTRRGAF